MNRTIFAIAAVFIFVGAAPVHADSLEKEHEKAKQGGYEKDFKESIDKYGGSRLKEEERNYQREKADEKAKQERDSRDTPDKFGKAYQDEQLGIQRKTRP